MVNDEINAVVSNSKLSISSSKIILDIMKRFFILIIDNKYARSIFIFQSLLGTLVCSLNIFCYSFHLGVKNLDDNDKTNKSKAKVRIRLKDKIN